MDKATKDGYTLDETVGVRICQWCNGRLRAYRAPTSPITSWRTHRMGIHCASRSKASGRGMFTIYPHEPKIPAMDNIIELERWLRT